MDPSRAPSATVVPLTLRPFEQRALDAVRAGHVEWLQYEGFHGMPSTCNFVCVVDGEQAAVILAQTSAHRGTSVTNCFEDLATKLFAERLHDKGVKPNNVSWFQHYDSESSISGKEKLDRVLLEQTGSGQRLRLFSATFHRVKLQGE